MLGSQPCLYDLPQEEDQQLNLSFYVYTAGRFSLDDNVHVQMLENDNGQSQH